MKLPATFLFSRILYGLIWLLTAIGFLLLETEIIPMVSVQPSPELRYALLMLSICLTLSTAWLSVGMSKFGGTSHRRPKGLALRLSHPALRVSVSGVAVLTNLFVYYVLHPDTSPMFCLLISLTAFIFCWPSVETESAEDDTTANKGES